MEFLEGFGLEFPPSALPDARCAVAAGDRTQVHFSRLDPGNEINFDYRSITLSKRNAVLTRVDHFQI
jgi:hypothetical protein